jgi:hypothetical protein
MRKISEENDRNKIQRLINKLQEEGGLRSQQFYSKIRNALWNKKDQSVRIGKKINEAGEITIITEPEEVKKYVQEAWQQHFTPKNRVEGTTVQEWIGDAKCIVGETESITKVIKAKEIKTILESIANNKAPRPTEETVEMIKWLDKKNVHISKLLFNAILMSGETPTCWKNASIYGIYKGGELIDPLNYRPIALISYIYKIFIKIINDWMVEVAEREGIISVAQAGFWKGMSTTTQIHAVWGLMEEVQVMDKEIHIMYIDLVGAYDSVPLDRMYETLHVYGFLDQIVNLIRTMYKNNMVSIITDYGNTNQIKVKQGV